MHRLYAVWLCLLCLCPGPLWAYDAAMVQDMLKTQEEIAGLTRKSMVIKGQRLSYLDNELSRSPRAIMLIHGFGDSSASWTYFARIFRDADFRIIIPDLLGFGQSERPLQADYRMQAQADRLLTLAQQLGIKEFHVAGNSMGGGIAAVMAAQSGHIRSLALLDAAGLHYRPTELDTALLGGHNLLLAKTPADFIRMLDFASHERPLIPQPVLDFLADRAVKDSTLHEKIFREALFQDMNFLLPLLPRITSPTLILWGQEDRVLHPDNAKIFQQYLPRSELRLLPEVGHMPMIEAPEKSARIVRDFIQGLDRAATHQQP